MTTPSKQSITPLKRRISVSSASGSFERAQCVSTPAQVHHDVRSEQIVGGSLEPVAPTYPLASLGGISEEPIINVFQHFEWDQNKLAKLCLTDRRYKRIAESCLYQDISYSEDNGQTKAIVSNTELSKHIKFMSLDFDESDELLNVPGVKTVNKELPRNRKVQALKNASNVRNLYIHES